MPRTTRMILIAFTVGLQERLSNGGKLHHSTEVCCSTLRRSIRLGGRPFARPAQIRVVFCLAGIHVISSVAEWEGDVVRLVMAA